MFGINASYADIAYGSEGQSMPVGVAGTAESPYIIEPPPNAVVIDFDDFIGAPEFFTTAVALRDRYADEGVTFDGPNEKDGGAILDELSNFGVSGQSSPNFLAFDRDFGFLSGGGVAQGPETIFFDAPVNHVQANVGAGFGQAGMITMDAYNASDELVGSDTVVYDPQLQTLLVQATGITKVIVTFGDRLLVLDDLAFVKEGWGKAYAAMLDSASDLDMLREYRDEILSRKARGRLYKRLLYNNSEDALEVLLNNPELISKARELIEANRDAVFDVLNGKKGVIHNTDEIIAFLKAFGKKSPRRLKALTKLVKKGMLRKKRKGRLFLGFKLK
jgi:hypothetical protein